MKCSLRLDYVTMNFDSGSMNHNKIRDSLASPAIDFCWQQIGVHDNSPMNSPFGVFYKPSTGYRERPHCVQVSGVGCEKFERTLPYLRSAAPNHISRIDFAFDVILSRKQWKEFIKTAFSSSLDSERRQRKYTLTGSGEAMTIYIGSRRSERYFRIYNKTLENPHYCYYDASGEPVELSNDQCVIRYEVEFHRFKRTLRGEKVLIDPTWMFDSYYSDNASSVCSEVLKYWKLYGDSSILPPDFDNLELECLSTSKQLFCQVGEADASLFDHAAAIESLHDLPRSYQSTVDYVFDKFSKYIPAMLCDPVKVKIMMDRARVYFGWPFVVEFESLSDGFNLKFIDCGSVPDFIDVNDDECPFDSYYENYENESLWR